MPQEFKWLQLDLRIQKVSEFESATMIEYTQRLTMSMHSNPKEFWKSFRPGKRTVPTTNKPNDFFVYFKSIRNPKNIIYEADDDIFEYLRTYQKGQLQTEYDQLNFSITDSEVHKAVSELKCGKLQEMIC